MQSVVWDLSKQLPTNLTFGAYPYNRDGLQMAGWQSVFKASGFAEMMLAVLESPADVVLS